MFAFLPGLLTGLSLIVAIGAQNAFVLRQGLRREHVGSVVLFLIAQPLLLAVLPLLPLLRMQRLPPPLAARTHHSRATHYRAGLPPPCLAPPVA